MADSSQILWNLRRGSLVGCVEPSDTCLIHHFAGFGRYPESNSGPVRPESGSDRLPWAKAHNRHRQSDFDLHLGDAAIEVKIQHVATCHQGKDPLHTALKFVGSLPLVRVARFGGEDSWVLLIQTESHQSAIAARGAVGANQTGINTLAGHLYLSVLRLFS